MPIHYPDILQQTSAPRTFSYGDKDVMLYALGIGLGADPLDARELPFVYEKGLKVVPTAATVLAARSQATRSARTRASSLTRRSATVCSRASRCSRCLPKTLRDWMSRSG